MGSEVLLYGYGCVCVSMLVFNIIYNITLKRKDSRLKHKSGCFAEKIEAQLCRIRENKDVDPGHITYLERKLSRIFNLIAFDKVLEEKMSETKDGVLGEYYQQLQPAILRLAFIYQKRENMQAAYFAHFLSRHRPKDGMLLEALQHILVDYMKKDSLYCKVNALQALYNFGNGERIADAVILLDRQGAFLHEKILTDGLLTFSGDHEHLISLLWRQFSGLSCKTQLSVLNYIRFKSANYCEKMLAIMKDPAADKELRLSAARYLGKYPYDPAKDQLMKFAADTDPKNWEYAAVSISSLAQYRGEDVIQVLSAGIHSSNWYVRSNAAASLEAHHLQYSDLIYILGGNDRYAREMMMYQLEHRNV